jgi:hypothetical protein
MRPSSVGFATLEFESNPTPNESGIKQTFESAHYQVRRNSHESECVDLSDRDHLHLTSTWLLEYPSAETRTIEMATVPGQPPTFQRKTSSKGTQRNLRDAS